MDRPNQSYHVAWYSDGRTMMPNVTVHLCHGRLLGIESGRTADAVDLGSAAMIPGLVNAHTHLEFSLLSQPMTTTGRFTDWIRSVVSYRQQTAAGDTAQAIRRGVAESIQSGTTLIGDIATTGWVGEDYDAARFSGVVFQELLGLGDARIQAQTELARSVADRPTAEWSSPMDIDENPAGTRTAFGLSPHAPYSVHPELLSAAVRLSKESARPLAMHLAETAAELELLAHGTGEFQELLTDFGIWRDDLFGGKTPRDFLEILAECPQALIVHGNYLTDDDLRFLASHPHMTLVYCPRTHAAFGHPMHPWRRLLELGGSVAIGTDSRASNPDLSLFAELQFLAATHRDVSHFDLLTLATRAGRTALLGKDADEQSDFCVVQWDPRLVPDPGRNLFAGGNRVVGTVIQGEWVAGVPS
jgi:cytosine/adenosine deaminase-related metal-dependent hydrolase